ASNVWRRWLQPLSGAWAVAKLSKAFIPNLPEPFGNLSVVVGGGRAAKSYAKVWGAVVRGVASRDYSEIDDLMVRYAKQGAIDIEVPYFPGRGEVASGHHLESVLRALSVF